MGTAQMGLLDLLDAAPAWMECMALAVHRRDPGLLALFSSCNKLQQLVLQQRSLRPKLSCKVQGAAQFGALTHVMALAMAEASHNNVHLSITDFIQFNRPIAPNSISYSMVAALGQAAFIHSQRTGQFQQPPAPYKLHCITVITLYSVDLDSLVPDFLVLGCPNLNELNLMYVTITGLAGPAQSTCTSLQTLSLDCCEALAPIQAVQQLPNLPSLTEVCITEAGSDIDYAGGGVFCAAIEKYSSHLECIHAYESSGHHYDHLPWSPGTVFPQLQSLRLRQWHITCDEDMRQLLVAASGATTVLLHSIRGLETSFAQESCSWEELTLLVMYVDQLAKLPLPRTRLACENTMQLRSKDGPVPTSEQITAGVAAAQAAGGVEFDGEYAMQIILYTDDVQLLTAAAVPLLYDAFDCPQLEVRSTGTETRAALFDSLPVLTALGQHVKCKRVELKTVLPEGVSDVEELQDLARQLMPHVIYPQFSTEPLLWES